MNLRLHRGNMSTDMSADITATQQIAPIYQQAREHWPHEI